MNLGDRLLDQYVNSAIAHGDASVDGNHNKANLNYDKIVKCFKELQKAGGSEKLLDLLRHDDASVRLWAATHSLESNEHKAVAVLHELSIADHFSSLSAQIVLDQWEKGEFVSPE